VQPPCGRVVDDIYRASIYTAVSCTAGVVGGGGGSGNDGKGRPVDGGVVGRNAGQHEREGAEETETPSVARTNKKHGWKKRGERGGSGGGRPEVTKLRVPS
jgi:hypothetical protein